VSEGGARRVRLDKWLWAARFYKTRSQSSAAIKGGKVEAAGDRAKPSHKVGVGDTLSIRKGPYEFVVEVTGLAERRGSAEIARGLYTETADSVAQREDIATRIAADRAAMPKRWAGGGRPTKKQRRQLMAFHEQFESPDVLDDIDWDWTGEGDE